MNTHKNTRYEGVPISLPDGLYYTGERDVLAVHGGVSFYLLPNEARRVRMNPFIGGIETSHLHTMLQRTGQIPTPCYSCCDCDY